MSDDSTKGLSKNLQDRLVKRFAENFLKEGAEMDDIYPMALFDSHMEKGLVSIFSAGPGGFYYVSNPITKKARIATSYGMAQKRKEQILLSMTSRNLVESLNTTETYSLPANEVIAEANRHTDTPKQSEGDKLMDSIKSMSRGF